MQIERNIKSIGEGMRRVGREQLKLNSNFVLKKQYFIFQLKQNTILYKICFSIKSKVSNLYIDNESYN